MEDYDKLLEEAYGKVKRIDTKSERFEIPKVDVQNVGNKTVFSNLSLVLSDKS